MNEGVSYVDEVISATAQQFHGTLLFSIEEIGIFPDVLPPTDKRVVSTATKKTSRYFGLASWVLSPLYVACKRRLAHSRTDTDAANVMLLVCPGFLTAWNVRKALFTPALLAEELHFSMLVLTREPKSAETWAHRSWILKTSEVRRVHIQAELRLAWMAASRAFSNYYSTVHRLRIIHMLDKEMLRDELQTSRKWLRTHVGDSSGWTYHRLLLRTIHELDCSQKQEESEWFAKLCDSYMSTHQNITVHHRWLSDRQFGSADKK